VTWSLVLALAPSLVAALVGISADMVRFDRFAAPVGGVLLAGGGAFGLWSAWNLSSQMVGEQFAVCGGFSAMGGLIAVLAAVSLFVPDDDSRISAGQRVALVSFAAVGASLAVHSTNVIVLVLSLETAGVCSYALVASARTKRSSEAAMKYFVQGAVATGLLVLGVAVLISRYAADGSYAAIAGAAMQANTALLVGVLLLVAALSVKSAVAPFHSWAPDAYECAPATASAVLAGPMKVGALSVLAVIVAVSATAGAGLEHPLGLLGEDLFPIIAGLAVLSIVVGSLAALRQRSLTRMLGYAGVAQVGYALIAIAASAFPTALIFIATYALGTVTVFLCVAVVRRVSPEWEGSVEDLAGFGKSHPVVGASMAIAVLSLAGIPPLIGFWGKFQVLQAAVALAAVFADQDAMGYAWMYGTLAVVGIAGAVISVAYYGAILQSLFSARESKVETRALKGAAGVVIVVLGLAILALGLAPLVANSADLVRGFLL